MIFSPTVIVQAYTNAFLTYPLFTSFAGSRFFSENFLTKKNHQQIKEVTGQLGLRAKRRMPNQQ